MLQAPTGSGKTTRVPIAVADALAGQGMTLVIEPRRLAARAAARRVSEENQTELGQDVGYRIRFENKSSKRTRLLFLTEGMLLALLRENPFLEGVAAVLFDEVHERSLSMDLGLSMVQRLRSTVREDLELIAMSATLDAQELLAFLQPAQRVETTGTLFPVEVEYTQRLDERALEIRVASGVETLLEQTPGSVLVFLPGVREIHQALEATQQRLERTGTLEGIELQTLYGDLSIEKQHAVLGSPQDAPDRRVVFATNVAESSVTLTGITAVLDSGLERRARFDPSRGLDLLELVPISRASAKQRKGRAGREQPGRCLRLWTQSEQGQKRAVTPAEVRRVDLTSAVLQLVAWGEGDVAAFPWFEAPEPARVSAALDLLVRLGALQEAGTQEAQRYKITSTGQAMASLGMHPRQARLLLEGRAYGVLQETARLVALLEERDLFERTRREDPLVASTSDLLDRLRVLEGDRDPSGRRVIHSRKRRLLDTARLLERQAKKLPKAPGSRGPSEPAASNPTRDELLRKVLLAGYPDRVASRRTQSNADGYDRAPTGKARMVGGRGLRLSDQTAVTQNDLFLALRVYAPQEAGQRRASGNDAWVTLASAIEEDWLDKAAISTTQNLMYDPGKERVCLTNERRYLDLPLQTREAALSRTSPAEVRAEALTLLCEQAKERAHEVLPFGDKKFEQTLARARSLAQWRPELGLPDLSEAALGSWVAEQIEWTGQLMTRFSELKKLPWLDLLQAALGYERTQQLDRLAPARLTLQNGQTLGLIYQQDQSPPVLAGRIQQFFGCATTPAICDGQIRVLCHLLAPNGRPQQITQDLESFWESGYHQVRAELAGRYTKHPWPKNPREAKPPARRPRKGPSKRRGS